MERESTEEIQAEEECACRQQLTGGHGLSPSVGIQCFLRGPGKGSVLKTVGGSGAWPRGSWGCRFAFW